MCVLSFRERVREAVGHVCMRCEESGSVLLRNWVVKLICLLNGLGESEEGQNSLDVCV